MVEEAEDVGGEAEVGAAEAEFFDVVGEELEGGDVGGVGFCAVEI